MQRKFRLKSQRFARELALRKLSQNAWAHKLGISKAYLSQLVNGHRQFPGTSLRHRILRVLELPEAELFEVMEEKEGSRGSDPARNSLDCRDSEQSPGNRLLDISWAGVHLLLETQPDDNRGGSMGNLLSEFKYALRGLRRNPAFAVIAILILALAIGANTTLFSAISAVLLQPPPFPEPDRVVRIWSSNPTQGWFRGSLSPPNFLDLRRNNQTFEEMAIFDQRNGNLTGGVRPLSIEFSWVSPALFPTLSVQPILGRVPAENEVGPGADLVAVISHRLWSSVFGEDPSVIGSTLNLDEQPLTIIGVMPPSFQFPSAATDLWKPYGIRLDDENDRGSSYVAGIGRLRPGVSLEQAQQDVERIAADLEAAFPEANRE